MRRVIATVLVALGLLTLGTVPAQAGKPAPPPPAVTITIDENIYHADIPGCLVDFSWTAVDPTSITGYNVAFTTTPVKGKLKYEFVNTPAQNLVSALVPAGETGHLYVSVSYPRGKPSAPVEQTVVC